ncbi:MAG: shikimate kinase [Lachnospiraceae bacterium]|nr:shikimate kinase [Lachnospiraceae bacterium]
MAKKNNVILIGFMGSGKTTVGIRLSYRMRRIFEDTDKLIEKKQQKEIKEIFATEGEDFFRKLETQMLLELEETVKDRIISVGGGTPVKEENREILKRLGTVVYLRIRPETVYERLKNDTTRPLLQGEDPKGKICSLMESRKDAYECCADYILDVDELSIEEILQEITSKVGEE